MVTKSFYSNLEKHIPNILRKINIFLIPLYFYVLFINSALGISISELSLYPKFCEIAAREDVIFQDFKRNPVYQHVLEHLDFNQGMSYLEEIKSSYPFMLDNIMKFKENDFLGNPFVYNYGDPCGFISPSTLRYIKVAGDLITLFGDLSDKIVVEIGGGYGGQCKVLFDATSFREYIIIDLLESCLLGEKYLNLLNVKKFQFFNAHNILNSPILDKQYDLLISNYAFSELSKDEQILYIDNFINRAKCGYMICNFTSDYFGLSSLTLKEIISLISRVNREVQVLDEIPNTFPNNVLIVWKEIDLNNTGIIY